MALGESSMMSANEIAAAGEVELGEFNAQLQTTLVNAPSFAVAGSYVDQAERAGTMSAKAIAQVRTHLAEAEVLVADGSSKRAIAAQLDNALRKAGTGDASVVEALTALKASLI
jgi:hypothetical protein